MLRYIRCRGMNYRGLVKRRYLSMGHFSRSGLKRWCVKDGPMIRSYLSTVIMSIATNPIG
jgi:hypothetical protein